MMALEIGKKATLTKKKFTEADVVAFAEASGDKNPVHLDEDFAKKTRFGKRIVHGIVVTSLISELYKVNNFQDQKQFL